MVIRPCSQKRCYENNLSLKDSNVATLWHWTSIQLLLVIVPLWQVQVLLRPIQGTSCFSSTSFHCISLNLDWTVVFRGSSYHPLICAAGHLFAWSVLYLSCMDFVSENCTHCAAGTGGLQPPNQQRHPCLMTQRILTWGIQLCSESTDTVGSAMVRISYQTMGSVHKLPSNALAGWATQTSKKISLSVTIRDWNQSKNKIWNSFRTLFIISVMSKLTWNPKV